MMLSKGVKTLVLVGHTGNGKSATGNTILGRRAFKSKASSSSVTSTCKLQKTILEDGQIINVIDTPGFFNTSIRIDSVGKEIVKCINLVKDGIHAFLVVLSIQTHFTKGEEAVIHTLKTLFGSKIINYMIFVFTGGDGLEDDGETLDDYFGHKWPQSLKDILTQCGDRKVLFDNKTTNRLKRTMQLQELLSLVDMVINQNDGKPYSNEMFDEIKVEEQELVEDQVTRKSAEEHAPKAQMKSNVEIDNMRKNLAEVEAKHKETTIRLEKKLVEEQVARKKVEAKLKEIAIGLEQKLAEEQATRKRVEEYVQEAQMKSTAEIDNLRKSLEVLSKEMVECHTLEENGCTIT